MMNNEMLKNIEYLREKANVSYEEAMELLQDNNDDVMRALIELEKKGRLYSQPDDFDEKAQTEQHCHAGCKEVKSKAASFFNKAKLTRLVIKRKNKYEEKETVANISALAAAGVAIIAPHFTFVVILLTLITGHQIKVETRD